MKLFAPILSVVRRLRHRLPRSMRHPLRGVYRGQTFRQWPLMP